jgi:hypothetical protein
MGAIVQVQKKQVQFFPDELEFFIDAGIFHGDTQSRDHGYFVFVNLVHFIRHLFLMPEDHIYRLSEPGFFIFAT